MTTKHQRLPVELAGDLAALLRVPWDAVWPSAHPPVQADVWANRCGWRLVHAGIDPLDPTRVRLATGLPLKVTGASDGVRDVRAALLGVAADGPEGDGLAGHAEAAWSEYVAAAEEALGPATSWWDWGPLDPGRAFQARKAHRRWVAPRGSDVVVTLEAEHYVTERGAYLYVALGMQSTSTQLVIAAAATPEELAGDVGELLRLDWGAVWDSGFWRGAGPDEWARRFGWTVDRLARDERFLTARLPSGRPIDVAMASPTAGVDRADIEVVTAVAHADSGAGALARYGDRAWGEYAAALDVVLGRPSRVGGWAEAHTRSAFTWQAERRWSSPAGVPAMFACVGRWAVTPSGPQFDVTLRIRPAVRTA